MRITQTFVNILGFYAVYYIIIIRTFAQFTYIFEKKEIIDDPTVYINITAKNEPNDAPEGCENWFVMINVPGNEGQDWDEIIKISRKNILDKLSRLLKTDIQELKSVIESLEYTIKEYKTQFGELKTK